MGIGGGAGSLGGCFSCLCLCIRNLLCSPLQHHAALIRPLQRASDPALTGVDLINFSWAIELARKNKCFLAQDSII